jgi:hypothetical protein
VTLEELLCALPADERCICWGGQLDVKAYNLGRGKIDASRIGDGEAMAWGISEGETRPRLDGGVKYGSWTDSSGVALRSDAEF